MERQLPPSTSDDSMLSGMFGTVVVELRGDVLGAGNQLSGFRRVWRGSFTTFAGLALLFSRSSSLRLLFLDVERSFLSLLRSLLLSFLPLREDTENKHMVTDVHCAQLDGNPPPQDAYKMRTLGGIWTV